MMRERARGIVSTARCAGLVTSLVITLAAGQASADSLLGALASADADAPSTGPHWAIGLGGFVALTGPADYGPAAELHVYPGGWLGHWGAAVYYRGFEDLSPGMVLAGLTYEAGRARPVLVIELHGEAGATTDALHCPVVGGGVRTQLRIWGPFLAATNITGHLLLDGIDTRLALAGSLTLGLGW